MLLSSSICLTTEGKLLEFGKTGKSYKSSSLFIHYSTRKTILLSCIPAVLHPALLSSHLHHEQPVAFASQTLSPVEISYAEVDREAFSIAYHYLLGWQFIIWSDQKPLQYLFGDLPMIIQAVGINTWCSCFPEKFLRKVCCCNIFIMTSTQEYTLPSHT